MQFLRDFINQLDDPKKGKKTLYLVMGYGQSVSTGYNGAPTLTTTVPAGVVNYKFAGGINSPSNVSDFVPLISGTEIIPTVGSRDVETPWVNCANILAQTYGGNFLAITAAVPSTTTSQRVKGTSIYTTLISLLTSANTLAKAKGYKLVVIGLADVSGESEMYGGATYYNNQVSIQSDFETDAKAITGQTRAIPMFMTDVATSTDGLYDVNIAMRDLVVAYPTKFYLAATKYTLTYADALHLDANGYKNLGALYAKAIGKVVFENTSFNTVYPTGAVRSGKDITITYHVPSGSLISDTVTVSDPGNWGFEWYDASTSATVSSVTILNSTQIKVTLNVIPTGSSKYVGYARTVWGAPGPVTGGRGNIKDGDGNWSMRFLIPAT